MIKFEFNVADLESIFRESNQELIKDLQKGVKLATNTLHTEIDKLTPEQTGTLRKGNRQTIDLDKNTVIGSIINKTPYAIYVEEGVGKTYNYHKNKSIIHRGKGNKGYERALEKKEKEIYKQIESNINL